MSLQTTTASTRRPGKCLRLVVGKGNQAIHRKHPIVSEFICSSHDLLIGSRSSVIGFVTTYLSKSGGPSNDRTL